MLKRFLTIVAVLLLFVPVGQAAQVEPAARLEAPQPVFDFGEVLKGESVEHTFEFVNTGDAPLLIDRVKSTCGCTGVLLSEKTILPGDRGTVKATFDSSRFQGAVKKRILVYSNAPGDAPYVFTVQGEVTLPLQFSPQRVVFRDVPVGEQRILSLELTNRTDAPLRIANLRTSNTAFRAEADELELAAGATTRLRVIASPDAETRHLGGAVLIRTDRPKLGEIRIPVSGNVLPESVK